MNKLTEEIREKLLSEFKKVEIEADYECYLKSKHIFEAFSTLKHTPSILTQSQLHELMDYLKLKEINLKTIKICKLSKI